MPNYIYILRIVIRVTPFLQDLIKVFIDNALDDGAPSPVPQAVFPYVVLVKPLKRCLIVISHSPQGTFILYITFHNFLAFLPQPYVRVLNPPYFPNLSAVTLCHGLKVDNKFSHLKFKPRVF